MSDRTIRFTHKNEYIAPAELARARMPPPKSMGVPSWVWATLLAACFSATGISLSWVYAMGNRVTALEQRAADRQILQEQFQTNVQQRLGDIQTQLQEINSRLDAGLPRTQARPPDS